MSKILIKEFGLLPTSKLRKLYSESSETLSPDTRYNHFYDCWIIRKKQKLEPYMESERKKGRVRFLNEELQFFAVLRDAKEQLTREIKC